MESIRNELETLYDQCGTQFYHCALAVTHCGALAEDAVHNAFRSAFQLTHAPENLKAYVYRIVRNAAIDLVRKDSRIEPLSAEMFFEIPAPQLAVLQGREFLEDFTLEWFVYEIDKDRIKLYIIGTDGDKIVMKRACDQPNIDCSEAFIADTLQNCVWAVSNGESQSFLDMLRIDFSDMNIHVRNPNETVVDEGNWEISGTTITFNNLSMEMANYIGEWEIIECRADRFKMKRGEEYLVVEKDCE